MATGLTPDLQLPYPEPGTGEPNNPPVHIKALAERLEEAIPENVEQQITAADIPRQVVDAVAASPTVAAAAVAAVDDEIAGRELVQTTDPGIPKGATDDGLHAAVWRSKVGRRFTGALTAGGRWKAKGFRYLAGSTVDEITGGRGASTYLRATIAASGTGALKRIAEDALLLDGTVPQWVLDRWSSRMSFGAGIGLGISQRVRGDVISTTYSRATVGAAPAGHKFRPLAEDTIGTDGTVPQWVLDRWATRLPGLASTQYPVLVVRPTPGVGEYATPKAANDAIADSGPRKRYTILVFPGDYTTSDVAQLNWTVKDYVSIVGTERDTCIIGGALADNSSDADITNTSVLYLKRTSTLANLTLTAKNMRYVVHSESSGLEKDWEQTVDNCVMIHHGNQAARDWRTANPGSGLVAANVWAGDSVWGYGSSSGARQTFRNSRFVSGRDPWYIHDREDWSTGAVHLIEGCELYSRLAVPVIRLQSLGSGRESTVLIRDTATNAVCVSYDDSPWITQTPAGQVANHAQIRATIAGNDKVGFATTCRGRALKISSATSGASSKVRVTGTAADVLMGQVLTRDYGYGVASYAFGRWDVSGILVGLNSNVAIDNTMGKRLGDCSTAAKAMQVTIDGSAPITVTFNADHTADNDATILGIINAALGSAGVASIYDVVAGEEYPSFPDRTRGAVNNEATTTIKRWTAVKLDGSGVKVLGTGDPTAAFYGIALEPIAPGKLGRILRAGALQTATQLRGVAGNAAIGTTIYHSDSTAGEFDTAGSRPALTVARAAGWAEF